MVFDTYSEITGDRYTHLGERRADPHAFYAVPQVSRLPVCTAAFCVLLVFLSKLPWGGRGMSTRVNGQQPIQRLWQWAPELWLTTGASPRNPAWP